MYVCSLQSQAPGSWTDTLKQELFHGNRAHRLYFHVRGPFGSSFEGFESNQFLMLIGGGSGVASSLSVLRELTMHRGEVVRCWFIYATRTFASVQWVFHALNDIMNPKDPSKTPPKGLIRLSIHVSARLTPAQQNFIAQTELRHVFRQGRPEWKKLFRSFANQSFAQRGIKKTKVCACANKAIYADIERALVEINDPTLDIEFSSENFE